MDVEERRGSDELVCFVGGGDLRCTLCGCTTGRENGKAREEEMDVGMQDISGRRGVCNSAERGGEGARDPEQVLAGSVGPQKVGVESSSKALGGSIQGRLTSRDWYVTLPVKWATR